MQFIENTRSRSSLIEYLRHFFIDVSIFGHHGGPPLEGGGTAASPSKGARARGKREYNGGENLTKAMEFA